MRLIQKSGTDDEGDIPGIALLLRRMLCSENLTVGTAGVLKDKLDELNLQSLHDFRAVNGLVPNVAAYCSEIENRCTEYNLFRLNNERTYAASCMGLLAQIAGNARFSAAELERQKQLVINEITNSDASVQTRYGLNGQMTNGKGLNIVRMSNGQVRKVMVK